jgi:hypothetical protein
VPTGSVGAGVYTANVTGLSASSCYYIWVRGNCGAGNKSIWSLEETFCTQCNTPMVTSTTGANRCGPGPVTLNAVPNAGSAINWYAAAAGGPILATGNSYSIPTLAGTTTFYAQAKAFGAIDKVGVVSPTAHGGGTGIQNFQTSMNFTATDDTTLQSVDIYPIASGQTGVFTLRTSSNITLQTFSFTTTVSGGNAVQTIPIGYALAPGNYNLYLSTVPASGIRMNTDNTIYPFVGTVADITGNPFDNTQYPGYYNWKFTTQCLSGRIPVVATVGAPPPISLSSSAETICQGDSTTSISLSGYALYNTLTWSPSSGVSGSAATGYVFNPSASTLYTLTATQTSGSFCSNIATFNVTVNPTPPPVTVVPASTLTLCQGTIQPLNGSVGTFSSVPIITEDFNGAAAGWVVANTSTDGDTAASQWTLHASTYNYASSTWNVGIKSNDNTQFFFANAQGNPLLPFAVTRTTLTSPAFSTVGFTSATLNFFQYLRYIGGDIFNVDVSTDNGASWTTVKTYSATQGTATAFSAATIDLSAYLAQATVKIRFNFESNWGYGWAVDNISLTGTVATALTWSPATDLYADPTATTPYVAGTPATVVYAKPTVTTVYSATATGANGCLSTGTITINIDALPIGGSAGADQVLCSGTTPSNLVLTGYTGNIVRWEYANDAAFTSGVTPIANTTDTLTPAQMGVITTIRYFRAVLGNGTCSNVYSAVTSVSYPTTTWNGSWSNGVPDGSTKAIFAAPYTATSDLTACAIQVTSGAVTINPGVNVIVGNEVTVTGGSLTFEDSASLIQTGNAVNSGNIIYKRNTTGIRKYDYTYWSSPVAGQTLTAFSPNTTPGKFYRWDTTINNWSAYSGVMQPAAGYIVRAPDVAPYNLVTTNIWTGVFTGVPNNGTITTPILKTAACDLNLIGNPYPSAISANLLLSDPSNLISLGGTIYLWTHNSPISANVYTQNDYAVYNLLGGVGTSAINLGINNTVPNGNISAGEGFFVHALLPGTATFRNSMRLLSSNNQFFRMNPHATPESNKHRLWLEATNDQGAYKQMLVGYASGATLNIDRDFDGLFVDGGNVVGLYSLIGNEGFTIQGRPLPFTDADVVPLGFRANVAGNFTISLAQFDGLFETQDVFLEDRMLGVVHNLKESGYTFASETGTWDTRFFLRYTGQALGVAHFDSALMVIYRAAQDWVVNTGNMQMAGIKVFDIQGRLLFENGKVDAVETRFNVGNTNEVLLVQVTSADGSVATKKIVN